jgi:hypothetical protein
MKRLLIQFPCLLIFVLLNSPGYAQMNIKIAGRDYYIPEFKDGPVKDKYTPTLEELKVLQPITASKNDVEIRVNYLNPLAITTGITILIKGNAQKFTVETIVYKYAGNIADSLIPKGAKIERMGNLKYYYTIKKLRRQILC